MKISKAQHSVLISAVHEIRDAKRLNFEAWLTSTRTVVADPEEPGISDELRRFRQQRFEEAKNNELYRKAYDNCRKQTILTWTNSQTLRSLERKGLITIIRDSAGERVGIDQIKVNFPVMA